MLSTKKQYYTLRLSENLKNRSKFSVIVTWKHADLSNGGLLLKSLVPFFRTYTLSVGFKMKPLRKSIFLCEDKDKLSFCWKTCWNAERSNHLFVSNWWIAFFKHLYSFKLVPNIFYQIFIFHQMIALQKLWKTFFISSKKLFLFLRYLIFCIFVFPSFFPCQPLL